jgi:hypothetical protein
MSAFTKKDDRELVPPYFGSSLVISVLKRKRSGLGPHQKERLLLQACIEEMLDVRTSRSLQGDPSARLRHSSFVLYDLITFCQSGTASLRGIAGLVVFISPRSLLAKTRVCECG